MLARYWKEALLLALVVVLTELFAWGADRILVARGLMSAPDDVSATEYEAYVERRDPLVGWPSPDSFGSGELDASGARVSPAFPDPETPACVAAFGDSFTFGDEVGPAEAYPNVLAMRLGCRIANYGVGGYGTDQAYLRWRERVTTRAPVVVLGHFAENIIRNVNRFRGFLAPSRFGLKPRFLVGASGALELLPLPALTVEEYDALWRSPQLLPDEYFEPGGPAGVVVMRFPYTIAALRVLGNYRVRSVFSGMPSYQPFYEREHDSGAFAVTLGVLQAFAREAAARGQRPVIALIPDEKDLIALAETGATSYAPLEQALAESAIAVPPIAEALQAALAGREPCALYARCGGAHFNPEGYARVAGAIGDWIEAHGGVEAAR